MDELQKYYEYLKRAGADVPPSFDSFRSTLQDSNSSRQYYKYLRDNNFDAPDNYESFVSTLGVKKKESSVLSAGGSAGFINTNGKALSGGLSNVASGMAIKGANKNIAGNVASSLATGRTEKQKISEALKTVKSSPATQPVFEEPEIEYDENDPVKSDWLPVQNKLSENRNKPVIESIQQLPQAKIGRSNENTELLLRKKQVESQRFASSDEAAAWLLDKLDKSKLVPTREFDITKPFTLDDFDLGSVFNAMHEGNMTEPIALKQYLDNRQVRNAIGSSNTLEEAVINYTQSQKNVTGKQVNVLGGDIPNAMKGTLIMKALNDPAFMEEVNKNPELKMQAQNEILQFPDKYPKAAARMMAELISNEREQRGKNSGLLNNPSEKTSAEIVNELFEKGEIPDQFKKFFEKPGMSFMITKMVKTPGFVENLGEGISQGVLGIGGSVAEITGVRNLYKSKTDKLYSALEKQYENVGFKPKGVIHNISTHGGLITGQILPMVGGGGLLRASNLIKSDAAANMIMTGLQTFGYNMDRARIDLPDASPETQLAKATIDTGVESALANIMNDVKLARQLVGGASPSIKNVIQRFNSKEISAAAAKAEVNNIFDGLVDKVFKFAKGSQKVAIQNANEEAATEILHNTNNQAFGGEPMSDREANQNAFDIWTTSYLGTLPLGIGGGISAINNNQTTGKLLFEMASSPDSYRELIQGQAAIDDDYAKDLPKKLENLQYISDVKKLLDEREGMNDSQKEKFLLLSLSEKQLKEKTQAAPDKSLAPSRMLKEIEIEKNYILNPTGKRELVEEFYDEKLIPKSDMVLLENNETGKFEPNKVGEYLKFVAQQANSLDENWQPVEGKPPTMSQYPQQLIQEANQRWAKEIDAAQPKIKIEEDEAPTSELAAKLNSLDNETLETIKGTIDEYPDASYDNENPPLRKEFIDAVEKEYLAAKADGSNPELVKAVEDLLLPKAKLDEAPTQDKIVENETKQATVEGDKLKPTEKEVIAEATTDKTGEPPTGKEEIPATEQGQEGVGITHAANEVRRVDRLLPEYEKSPQTFEEWNNEAEKAIKDGYDVEKLMDKIEKGHDPTPIENSIRKIYIATLDAEIAQNPTDALLAKQKRFIEIGDLANSRAGRNLVSLKGEGSPLATISDFYVAKMEASGVGILTEQQKKETKEAFDNVQKADQNATAAMEAYREEIAKLKAENELLKQKKAPKPKTERKDYAAERKQIVADILLTLKNTGEGASFLGVKELVAIAPGVGKLVKNLVADGVTKLSDVVEKVYETLKDAIPNIDRKDIQGIIAGEYNAKRPTRNELAAKMRDLRDEAYYINKLDKLLKGEEPTNERKRIERNRQITELREKIKGVSGYEAEVKKAGEEMLSEKAKRAKSTEKELGKVEKELDAADEKAAKEKLAADEKERKRQLAEAEKERKQFEREFAKEKRAEEKAALKAKLEEAKRIEKELSYRSPEEKALDAIIKRNETETAKIKERITKGDFETKKPVPFLENKEMQKKFPKEYKVAIDAIIKKEETRHEFDVALLKEQMARRSLGKKGIDLVGDVLGTTRALVTGIDASGIGIQNLMAMVAHPRSAAKSLPASFGDFVSAKNQDRWLASVHSSELYPLAQKAGLDITEPQSLKESQKEEIFTHNLLDKQIKVKGKKYVISKYTTKPFERIFTGLGNRMRWNLWARGVDKLYEDGYTWEKHPEEFKSLATVLNTETGRGKLHPQIDKAYNLISAGIWSPRLMASRLNILGFGDLGNAVLGGKKGYYGGLTPRMREYAVKDLVKFILFGVTMKGFFGLTIATDVENNPNKSTFCTFAVDGKRYNIFGGFTQYVRVATKLAVGGEIGSDGEFRKSGQLKTALRFIWSKTTPVVGAAIGGANKDRQGVSRDYMGDPVTFGSALESVTIPLSIRGIAKGIKNEGASSIIWTGIPSFVGVNVSYESDFDKDKKPKIQRIQKPQNKVLRPTPMRVQQ